MRWIIISCVPMLAACNLNNEKLAPDATGAGDGDASIISDAGVKGCDAGLCKLAETW